MTSVGLTAHIRFKYSYSSEEEQEESLRRRLEDGTSLNASERIGVVTAKDPNKVIRCVTRNQMRLQNLWHKATYVVIRHVAHHVGQFEDTYILVQKRSMLKDYGPGKLDPTPGGVVAFQEDPTDNAIRELQEEMGIQIQHVLNHDDDSDETETRNTLKWIFNFPYQDNRVKVWGHLYECVYHGALHDLKLQVEEVDQVHRLSLQQVNELLQNNPHAFLPDACHAIRLYLQRQFDVKVNRRLLKGYSSSNLYSYKLRPRPKVIFFDCDDTLYFDHWKTAKQLTNKIDEWCINHGLKPGQAYELYKAYGTALRGLLAEGYLQENDAAIDGFLKDVHDIPIATLLQRDDELRQMLLRMDPTIPKYIFTASVAHHAQRCLQALGIDDLFHETIIDCKLCNFESKHSQHSFQVAMKIAGIDASKEDGPETCLFLDDNMTNIRAAREVGWRSVLVGRVGRDCGQPISSEHAELEIDRIHDLPNVLPELFLS